MPTLTLNRSSLRVFALALLALAVLTLALPAVAQPPMPDIPPNVMVIAESYLDSLIPFFAIFMVFGAPAITVLLLVFFVFRSREKQQRLLNERLQRFLEAGQPIPDALLTSGVEAPNPHRILNQGLLFLGLGIGLAICLGLLTSWKIASVALILIGAGIARLISWKLNASSQDDSRSEPL